MMNIFSFARQRARFSEGVDGFPLPKGHSQNPSLQAPQKEGAEAFLKGR